MMGAAEVLTICRRDGTRHVRRGCCFGVRHVSEGFSVGAVHAGHYSAMLPCDGGYRPTGEWEALSASQREGLWSVGLGDLIVRGEIEGQMDPAQLREAHGSNAFRVRELIGGEGDGMRMGRYVEVVGG